MSDQRISVALRIRPPLEREKYEPLCARKANDGQTISIKLDENSAAAFINNSNNHNNNNSNSFQFDFVFDAEDEQQGVYEECVQEMVDHSLSGFNSTVFTYGQTGSGKTFTILGNTKNMKEVQAQLADKRASLRGAAGTTLHMGINEGNKNDVSVNEFELSPHSGMFLRVFQDLFHYKESVQDRVKITISLSALELYVEDVMDLLSKNKKKLKLRETPEDTLALGLTLVEVHNMLDVIQNFEIANSFRSVTATKMNDTSSRSHALFFIDIFQIPKVNPKSGQPNPAFVNTPSFEELVSMDSTGASNVSGLIRSRIALVDLAGSERVKKSGVSGQAMVEAQAINKSLSTLGTVINAMYTQQSHIPFRESKLTKLLKNSLVDTKSKLLLIGQVSPPSSSADESLGTLRFCDRVKGLKAGQVSGFASVEEEESYLRSVRLDEELTAELRILNAQYYYTPQCVNRLAMLQNASPDAIRQQKVQYLRAHAAELEAEKEREFLAQVEAEQAKLRDREVEEFVLNMNRLIEEYEEVAQSVKKEKKRLKKEVEQREAEQEEVTHEAKKYKKARVKLEEKTKDVKLRLAHLRQEEQELDETTEGVQSGRIPVEGSVPAEEPIKPANPLMVGETEEAIHGLVENFFNHAMEQNGLYNMYVSRLRATGRQRSQVRHMKLMSSDLVTDGSLLFDVLAFMVDRAVDISEGVIKPDARWTWHDVDGLSKQLLAADSFFPPMLPDPASVEKKPGMEPTNEEFHKISFLSSDESDGENSHHAAESRRPRNHRNSASGAVDSGSEEEEAEPEMELKKEKKEKKHKTKHGNFTSGELDKMGNSEENLPPAPGEAVKDKSKKKKKQKEEGDESDDDNVEKEKKSKKEGRKKHDGDGDEKKRGKKSGQKKSVADSSDSDDDSKEKNAEETGSSVSGDSDEDENEKEKTKPAPPKTNNMVLQQVYDSPDLVKSLLNFLRVGSILTKHGRQGKPHQRIFWVSLARGNKQLLWRDTKFKDVNGKSVDRSSIAISSISYIQLGCFSKVFKRHYIPPTNAAFFTCFTVGLKKNTRTIDVVADNTADFEAWVVGLCQLAGVDPAYGGKLDISREQGFESLTYFESSLCEANYIYPMQYLTLKKEVQRRAARTLEVLEECGNDRAKAHKKLGGIHPPEINSHGALYMTKGELRFLLPELNLDIFRITQIWLLFKQIGLIYDDNFIPITAFGVTRRE